MLGKGAPLKFKFRRTSFDYSSIVNSRTIYIKNNNTRYCEKVLITPESFFVNSYFNNPEARIAINVTLYHIVNVLMTPAPFLSSFNGVTTVLGSSNMYWIQNFFVSNYIPYICKSDFTFERSLENVLHTGCPYINVYGHFIWDILCPFLILPPELIRNSTIFIHAPFKGISTCALKTLFDVKENQLEFVNFRTKQMRKWYFAKNLYILDAPKYPLENYQIMVPKLIKYIKNKYQISAVAPYRYFLHNRKKEFKYRVIPNFDNLVMRAQSDFPGIDWETKTPIAKNFYDIISYYHTVKLYFTPTGSDVFHAMFMQPDTVVIIAMTWRFNVNDIAACYAAGVFSIVFSWKGMVMHHQSLTFSISENLFSKYVSIGIQTLELRSFPNGMKLPTDVYRCWK